MSITIYGTVHDWNLDLQQREILIVIQCREIFFSFYFPFTDTKMKKISQISHELSQNTEIETRNCVRLTEIFLRMRFCCFPQSFMSHDGHDSSRDLKEASACSKIGIEGNRKKTSAI